MVPVLIKVGQSIVAQNSTENLKLVAGPKKIYAIYIEGTEKVNEVKDKLAELKDTIENTLSKPLSKKLPLEE